MKKVWIAMVGFALAGLTQLAMTEAQPAPGAGLQGGPGGFRRMGDNFGLGAGLFGPGGHRLRFLARRLDLSEEQKEGIRSLTQAGIKQNRPLLESLGENREALREATANGQFDEATVSRLAQEQAQIMAQLIVEKERLQHQIYLTLTPEQQEKLNQLMEKFQSRRGGGFGPPEKGEN